MGRKYVLGLDYGTESARALVIAVDNGEEVATAVERYPDVVIDEVLPSTGKKLPPDWALQNPRDYLSVREKVIPRALKEAGIGGDDVIGIGTDFTAQSIGTRKFQLSVNNPLNQLFLPISPIQA